MTQPLDKLTSASEKELLDYLATEIVGRMNTLPAEFSKLFRRGVMYRHSLHGLAENVVYPPMMDTVTSDKGLQIRFMTADGQVVHTLFFAFSD